MAATDHPLKRLVSTFITEFASWLWSTPVRAARPLNVELPADILMTDQVFQVTLDDGRALVLHIEFQGRRSQPPMRWRMLEYMHAARRGLSFASLECGVLCWCGRRCR